LSADLLRPELFVPVLMGCALLWWIGRAMSWPARLAVATITLAAVAAILWFERR
jgi:hypothetical protein